MRHAPWVKSIRFQLTFWYTLVLAVVFTLTGGLLYAGVWRILLRQTDQALSIETSEIAEGLVRPSKDGGRATARGGDKDQPPDPFLLISRIASSSAVTPHSVISHTVFVRLARRSNGQTVALSEKLARLPGVVASLARMAAPSDIHPYVRFAGPDEEHRVRCLASTVPSTPYFLQVAISWDPTEDFLTDLSLAIAGSVLLLLSVCGAGSWLLIGRTLRPIDEIVTKSEEMTGSHFSPVLLPEGPVSDNEVGHLVTALNAMMMRLHAAFEAQRRFTADSSHELRTPLTILQGEFELALSRERSQDQYKRVLESGLEETARMARIVDSLAVLARYDAAHPPPHSSEELSLTRIVDEAAEALKRSIREKQMRITIDSQEPAIVHGNADSLGRLVRNLIENAITYSETGGKIEIKVESRDGCCRLTVRDSGVGISPEDLPHIFERFYRADKARFYNGGSGLGLSIVHSIVEEHGGKITVDSKVGEGTLFTVTLPCQATASKTNKS
jgi:heavy metal sensor kinase